MKKIIALLFILGATTPLINCMEEKSINTEYRELKDKLNALSAHKQDYITRLMQDYSLSKDEAEKEYYDEYNELFYKVRDAYKLQNM